MHTDKCYFCLRHVDSIAIIFGYTDNPTLDLFLKMSGCGFTC